MVKHRAALLRPASRWDSQPTGLLVEGWGRSGMWCHVLLIMPLLGLGLFALLPWPVALPSYLVLVAVSLALYVKVIQAMRQPVRTGREAMLGAVVTVTRARCFPGTGAVPQRAVERCVRAAVDCGREGTHRGF